jgi:hypothetical protein
MAFPPAATCSLERSTDDPEGDDGDPSTRWHAARIDTSSQRHCVELSKRVPTGL